MERKKDSIILILLIVLLIINTGCNNKTIFLKSKTRIDFNDYLVNKQYSNYKIYYDRPAIKGLFVNAPAAGSKERLDNLIDIANTTEINSFVVDVKEDDGRITYMSTVPKAIEIGASVNYIRDMEKFMDRLYDNNIYPIARIVVFKDPYLARQKPEYGIKNKDGTLWEHKGIPWLNPYNEGSWEYIIDIAKEAIDLGFKEIQFDYIRFEATRSLDEADFDGFDSGRTKQEAIIAFLDYANSELGEYDVEISVDVFGTIINSKIDSDRIGQDYLEMAKRVDVICPMVYPSHYGFGFFGLPSSKHTDHFPYEVIYGSMKESNNKYDTIEVEKLGTVRPWLQAFTASYLRTPNYRVYDGNAIRAQIQGVYDAGLEEWLLWNAGSRYSKDGLLKE